MAADNDSERTNPLFTETCVGPIPHKAWRGIACPVKLATVLAPRENNSEGRMVARGFNDLPMPARNAQGQFIYAFPGGGEGVL